VSVCVCVSVCAGYFTYLHFTSAADFDSAAAAHLFARPFSKFSPAFPYLFIFFLNICLGAARFAFPLRAPNAFNFDEELSGGAARKSRKLSAQKHYGNGTQRVSEARSTSSWRSCCCFVFLEIRPKSWGEWAETLVAQRTLPCCRLFGNTSECCPSH